MPAPINNPSPDELRRQALAKMQEAILALRNYRLQAQANDTNENRIQVNESTVLLIKEARAVGASGKVCDHCGGSGRQ